MHALHVERYPSAAEFLGAAAEWLAAAEAENNLILSVARLLHGGDHPFHDPLYFAALKETGRIVGCALCAPPDGLELSELPPGAARLLVGSVAEVHPRLKAVGGPRAPALEFASAWVRERGGAWQVRHFWRLFRLERVVAPRKASGALRLAGESDWPQLCSWAPDYARELHTVVDVAAVFGRWLARRSLYVWDDAGPKCVVGISGSTPRGARISAVYTPPEFRKRGYASNAVAAASQKALDGGAAFCVLFTDREPSAPARIYRSVGFEPVRDHFAIDLGV